MRTELEDNLRRSSDVKWNAKNSLVQDHIMTQRMFMPQHDDVLSK
jgi:hypothetical protein